MKKIEDLTGKQFSRWTVLDFAGRDKIYKSLISWKCRCQCGTEKNVLGMTLRNGNSKSCGCLKLERLRKTFNANGNFSRTHGMKNTRIYHIWEGMKQRCLNNKASNFSRYGGRGIVICKRWLKFENFLKDMGIPSIKKTLDRINNDGNYEPPNCRWSTLKQQNNNHSKNVRIKFGEENKTVAEWAEKTGLTRSVILYRLKLKLPANKILSTEKEWKCRYANS